jgi:hypothetical protein
MHPSQNTALYTRIAYLTGVIDYAEYISRLTALQDQEADNAK